MAPGLLPAGDVVTAHDVRVKEFPARTRLAATQARCSCGWEGSMFKRARKDTDDKLRQVAWFDAAVHVRIQQAKAGSS